MVLFDCVYYFEKTAIQNWLYKLELVQLDCTKLYDVLHELELPSTIIFIYFKLTSFQGVCF